MELTKEDFFEIKRLCEIKVADMGDKNSAQLMIQRYINPGAKYCLTCDPAVRQMFITLKEWSKIQGIVFKDK